VSDVVGTAFVRIKALTQDLAKQIEDGVKKGMADAKVKRAVDEGGRELGESLGGEIADSTSDTLKKRSKDIIPGDDIGDEVAKLAKTIEKDFDDAFDSDAFRDKLFDAFKVKGGDDDSSNIFSRFFSRFRKDRDDSDDETKRWATRMRSHFDGFSRNIGKNSPIANSLAGLSAKFNDLGKTSLPGLSSIGVKIGLIGGAIVGALPYIQDVGAGIVAYVTGLVAQIGFLATALGGVGVAAGAALGSVALSALPIFLAFKSETELLVNFKDSVAAAGEEFLKIGTATQQTLLPALDEALFVLGDLVPTFSEFGLFVGRAIGNYAKLATGILVGEDAQGRFQVILQSTLRILDLLLPSIIHAGDILSGIWVAAAPAAERFAGAIHTITQRWAEIVSTGLESGELTQTLDTWYDRAEILGRSLGNLFGALWDIFSIGADSSSSVFTRFDEWARRFRDFTESEVGQNKLALIFENALAVMHEINGIAKDLFDGILGRLTEVGGVDSMVEALQRFRDVIPEIQEFWADAYETIKQVVELFASNIWEKITQAWDQMGEPLGRLATQIMDLLETMDESGAFEVFLGLMETLANVLSTVLAIPGFGTFVAYFLAFGGAIKVAGIVLGPFIGVFGKFAGVISQLIAIRAAGAIGGVAQGLGGLASGAQKLMAAKAAGVIAEVGGAAGVAATKAGGLAPAIAGISGGLKFLGPYGIAAGIGVAAVGAAFFKHQQDAQRWKQEIRQVTDALGLLNGGLIISADGVEKYIVETSRFNSRNQLDDLARLGLSYEDLARGVADGTMSYRDFTNAAIRADEVSVLRNDANRRVTDLQVSSLESLRNQYKLTNDQLDDLARGEKVRTDGVTLMLGDNDDLVKSFKELNEVIGAAAKESIDEFATNAQNIRLLGSRALVDIKNDIDDASDEEAADKMADAQERLRAAAKNSAMQIKGLSDATRAQVLEQARAADGSINWVAAEQLLQDALAKQNRLIRDNLKVFNSIDFATNFADAKTAVVDFNTLLANTDFSIADPTDSLDVMLDKFPQVSTAAYNLFNQLGQLPEAEFQAAAEALGVDAEVLKDAMNGAQQAIIDLQNQALESLPAIGELLDESTSTKEDGSQYFDREGFVDAVRKRTTDTQQFGANIKAIQENIGDEAARIAVQQGPEAAANMVTMIGHNGDQLAGALQAMEDSEVALREQIAASLGPGIALEYATQAKIVGDQWGGGIARGINSPETLEALKGSSLDTLNELARGFKGQFEIKNGVLSFKHTGVFRRTNDGLTPGQRRALFSKGGFVEKYGIAGTFNKSFGTDTVPAMLTPGEYVSTASTVSRLGVDFFDALNSGFTPVTVGESKTSRTGGRGGIVFEEGAIQVAAQGVSASAVIEEMNAKLGWQLTTRGDR
jgi:hypothetical protein